MQDSASRPRKSFLFEGEPGYFLNLSVALPFTATGKSEIQ